MRPSQPSIQNGNKSLLSNKEVIESNLDSKIYVHQDTSSNTDQYGPSTGWCAQWQQLSYNIKLILIYNLLWGASISIWNRQLLAAYIFKISGKSTEMLGFIEAMQGAGYLLAAFIAGIIIDRSSSRISIIRFSGSFGLFIVAPLGIVALLCVNKRYEDKNVNTIHAVLYKGIYYIWLFLFGICSSFCNTIIGTVFTDLIPKGKRNYIFAFQWFLRRMASTLGPLTIVGMFYFLGNHWNIYEMNIVVISGIAIWCIPLLMLVSGFNATQLQITTQLNDAKETNTSELKNNVEEHKHKLSRFVPWILLSHRLVVSTGAGMTVKFFPIFFEQVVGLKPIALNSIYVATPFTTAIFTILVERTANMIGRIRAMIMAKLIGISCLVSMALITTDVTKYANAIIVCLFVIRTGAQNCAYPLEKATLMDHVDKKNRGKWNAIESLNSTVWTLSAALGGYLIGCIGYRDIYLITASIYFFGVLLLVPLNFITK